MGQQADCQLLCQPCPSSPCWASALADTESKSSEQAEIGCGHTSQHDISAAHTAAILSQSHVRRLQVSIAGTEQLPSPQLTPKNKKISPGSSETALVRPSSHYFPANWAPVPRVFRHATFENNPAKKKARITPTAPCEDLRQSTFPDYLLYCSDT